MTDRWRRPLGDDRGLSLPELLVTITLLTIISGAIVASVVAIQRNLGVANATMLDMGANRIAVERVAALLRGAVGPDGLLDRSRAAVEVAQPDLVRFYSITGQDDLENPVRVEVAVTATGDLVERIWDPVPLLQSALAAGAVPAYADLTAPDRTRTVARDLVSAQVFTYRTHAEDAVLGAASRCGRVLPAPAGADLALVDSVSIRVQLQEPTGYASAPSDLQAWARFASDAELGFSGSLDSAGCLESSGFAYDDAYPSP